MTWENRKLAQWENVDDLDPDSDDDERLLFFFLFPGDATGDDDAVLSFSTVSEPG